MHRILVRLIAAAALAPCVADAQQCGDTLYQSTTLQNDIVCPLNAPFGLRIEAPNVRLDLNGHSIVVPTSHPSLPPVGPICSNHSVGVDVVKADDAIIHGGRIEAGSGCSDVGVRFLASDRGVVDGVVFDTPRNTAVSIVDSSDVTISGNTFNSAVGVAIGQSNPARNQPSRRAHVEGNTMPATGQRQRGLVVIGNGAGAADSVIAYNKAERVDYLLSIGSGNDNVHIIGNVQHSVTPLSPGLPYPSSPFASISVVGSDNAVIVGNRVEGNRAALQLEGHGHLVKGNNLSGFDVAIEIGAWIGASGSTLHNNQMTTTNNGNWTSLTPVTDTGLWFGPHAHANDGRGNRFGQVATPVVDQGSGNIY